jgi:peptidyl-prolyl cis-trans isomerase SurA
MRFFVLISLCNVICISTQAQDNSSSTLLRVENDSFTVADFLKVYDKQTDDKDQKVSDQFDLFVDYRLKVKEAQKRKIDTLSNFQKEFKRYRNQLADNYIASGKVTDDLVKETYERLKIEVKASHILIKVPDTASTDSRQKLYQKAKEIAGKAKRGADFESLALQYSEDPSVKRNKGNLGWFRAFQMVYPFESAVYNQKVGEISSPVETQYGYHIIKKTDQRKSQGKITVAHIMIKLNQKDSTGISAKQKVDKIYSRIQKGEDFSQIAQEESDDKKTASKGGQLNPFSVGDINSDSFEKTAFSIENGAISKPFRTRFGWHIIKKIGNEPIPPLEEKKSELVKRIKTSKRVKLLNNKIQKNILQYHDMSVDSTIVKTISQAVDSTIHRYKWKASDSLKSISKTFLSIDNLNYSVGDFAGYFEKQQRTLTKKSQYNLMVKEALGKYVYAKLVKHHKNQLEELAPDFKAKMKNYKEGLMVFELMEREVWNKAKDDSIGLKKYYQQHKKAYYSKPQISGLLVDAKGVDQLKKLKQQVTSTDSLELIKKAFPTIKLTPLDKHPIDDSRLPEKLKIKENQTKIYNHANAPKIVKIKEFHPKRQLAFEEAKGRVVADYQDQLETKFIKRLRKKYNVEVDHDVLKKIKRRL